MARTFPRHLPGRPPLSPAHQCMGTVEGLEEVAWVVVERAMEVEEKEMEEAARARAWAAARAREAAAREAVAMVAAADSLLSVPAGAEEAATVERAGRWR